jgi:hypothetical protein
MQLMYLTSLYIPPWTVSSANDIPIWGCQVLVPVHDLKKADSRSSKGILSAFPRAASSFDGWIQLWTL